MATNQSQSDWAKTALRLPKDLHKQVHEVAKAEDRSFNSQIVSLLREGIRAREKETLVEDIFNAAKQGAAA